MLTEPLWPVVAHVVERPRVFNDKKGDPLWIVEFEKDDNADDHRNRVDNKERDIE
jgi:hypothetical protein